MKEFGTPEQLGASFDAVLVVVAVVVGLELE